ncbi:MAG: hypothetical protein HDS43_01830 [Bacteroides sp.]|nr:hypothetical protein [Bacteroides sp.]
MGNRIREVFEQLPKHDDIEWFAKQIPCTSRHLYRIFRKDNIDLILLQRISIILQYNFFKDLSLECDNLIEDSVQ